MNSPCESDFIVTKYSKFDAVFYTFIGHLNILIEFAVSLQSRYAYCSETHFHSKGLAIFHLIAITSLVSTNCSCPYLLGRISV
jgi:hypothetical protein